MIRALFWNADQQRIRALWRFVIFLLVVAAIANPLILLLDATQHPLLESSFKNPIVAFAFLLALWVSAKFIDRRSVKDFGLHISRNWWRELGIGFTIGGLIMSFLFLTGLLFGWIEISGFSYSEIAAPFALVFLGQIFRYTAGSFFKELMSRSYLLRTIAEGLCGTLINRKQALIISWLTTSVLFGVLHLFNNHATVLSALNLSLLGILFGMGMFYTGRLAFPIGLHLAWNIFQNIIFGLPNSGKPAITSLFVTNLKGPALWMGGAFGPEGGLLAMGVIVVGIILVWLWLCRVYGKPTLQLGLSEPPIGISTDS